MTGHKWPDLIILSAGTITALGVLWRKLLQPCCRGFLKFVRSLTRVIAVVEEVGPVLIGIGQEFQPNGGGSLRDSIDRIEVSLKDRGDKLDQLYDYAHGWRHEQSNQIAGLTVRDEAITRRLDELRSNDTVKIRKLDEIAAVLPDPPTA